MSTPVGAIGAATEMKYAVAVMRKERDLQNVQGEQAVALIQSTAPALSKDGTVGTQLDIVA